MPQRPPLPTPAQGMAAGKGLLAAGLLIGLTGLGLAIAAALDDAPTADLARPLLGLLLLTLGLILGAWGLRSLSLAVPVIAPPAEPIPLPALPPRTVEAHVVSPHARDEGPALVPEVQHSCGAWNEQGTRTCRGCGAPL